MNQRYVAPRQTSVAMPAAAQAVPQAAPVQQAEVAQSAPAQTVVPGWYPDPWAQGEGHARWWDGINWSPDYVRGPQTAPAAADAPGARATAVEGFQVPSPAKPREDNSPGSIIAILVGLVLIAARIAYMRNSSTAGHPDAYNDGAAFGNIFGMFVSAFIFSWGFTRRLNGDNFSPSQTIPIAIGITVIALIISTLFL